MPDKITEPIAPDVLNPEPFSPFAGDYADDDAQVYEDDFERAPSGPEKVAGVPHPIKEIKPTTRLLTRRVTVGNGAPPLMILPADPKRTKCAIQVQSVAEASLTIADTNSDCYNGNNWISHTSGLSFDLDSHTGALWAYSTDATDITVNVIVVTV